MTLLFPFLLIFRLSGSKAEHALPAMHAPLTVMGTRFIHIGWSNKLRYPYTQEYSSLTRG